MTFLIEVENEEFLKIPLEPTCVEVDLHVLYPFSKSLSFSATCLTFVQNMLANVAQSRC